MSTTTPHTQTAYKDTPIGKIPADWEIIQLKSVIEELEAGVSVNSIDDEVSQTQPRVLKTSSVSGGAFFPHESKIIAPSDINKAKLNPRKDSIIISRMNTPDLVGETGFVERNYPTLFLPDRLWQTKFRSDNNSVYPKWLNFLLSSSEYKLKIKDIATGTSNSMKNISKQAFLNLKIPLPPLPEQQRIAKVLSTWDQAIQLTEQLIRQKEQRKKWLMQNLLTGKMRLKGFSGEWKEMKIGDTGIIPQKTAITKIENHKLLTVRLHTKGIEFNERDKPILSKTGRPYYERYKGEILIGRQNIHNGGIGLITEEFDGHICSNAITSFIVTRNCTTEYLLYYLQY